MAGLEDLLGGVVGGGDGSAPDLGGLIGGLTGGAGSGAGGPAGLDLAQLGTLVPALAGMLQGGGLQRMLGGLAGGGLGDATASWLGSGSNQQVDAATLEQAVGPQVQQLAERTGLTTEQAGAGLAQVLPGLVDQLSPDGALPESGQLDALLGQLGGFLSGR